MKNLLFYSLLCFSLHLSAEEGIPQKSLPSYFVTESKADKTLKRTETAFTFSFYSGGLVPVKDEIKMSYNGIGKTIKPDAKGIYTLSTEPGKVVFRFFYNSSFFEITTDTIAAKPAYTTGVQVNFQSSIMPVICDKPVIYTYPAKQTEVCMQLKVKGTLDFTYPTYHDSWKFTANTDGSIDIGNKKYHYLFWDGKTDIDRSKINLKEGYVVWKKDLVDFFEVKLSQMGLNSKEIDDYITYWCPRMNANEKNYIHFLFNEEYNEFADLTIEPKPDQLFRVFMLWDGVTENLNVTEQKLETFVREGFTVVEWGGAEVKGLENNLE